MALATSLAVATQYTNVTAVARRHRLHLCIALRGKNDDNVVIRVNRVSHGCYEVPGIRECGQKQTAMIQSTHAHYSHCNQSTSDVHLAAL